MPELWSHTVEGRSWPWFTPVSPTSPQDKVLQVLLLLRDQPGLEERVPVASGDYGLLGSLWPWRSSLGLPHLSASPSLWPVWEEEAGIPPGKPDQLPQSCECQNIFALLKSLGCVIPLPYPWMCWRPWEDPCPQLRDDCLLSRGLPGVWGPGRKWSRLLPSRGLSFP